MALAVRKSRPGPAFLTRVRWVSLGGFAVQAGVEDRASLAAFASSIGVSERSLCSWLRGDYLPPLWRIAEVAERLHAVHGERLGLSRDEIDQRMRADAPAPRGRRLLFDA